MKDYKDLSTLEKIGGAFVLLPFLIPIMGVVWAFFILYDGFIFQQIWNLLAPKAFNAPQITLIQGIVVGLLIGYHQIRKHKIPGEKADWVSTLTSPLIFWLIAWLISNYFI